MSALSFLQALAGGVGGYNQGQAEADAIAARNAQLKQQAEQMARDNYFRQQQLNQQGEQFKANLAESKADREARLKAEADRLQQERDLAKDAGANALFLATPGYIQSHVGQSLPEQQQAGEDLNARRAQYGLPPIDVPNAPSGLSRLVPGATVGEDAAKTLFAPPALPGSDLEPGANNYPGLMPTRDVSTYEPILNPAWTANPSTAATQANTAAVNAETAALPTKIKAAQEQQAFENRLALDDQRLKRQGIDQEHRDKIFLARMSAENNVSDREAQTALEQMRQAGENKRLGMQLDSAGTIATGKANALVAQQTNKRVQALTALRDKQETLAQPFRIMRDTGIDPKSGNELSPVQKKAVLQRLNQLSDQWKYYDNQIGALTGRKPTPGTAKKPSQIPGSYREPGSGYIITPNQ